MTVEDNIISNDHLFSEKLRKYEEKIVEFLLDIAESKRVNPKISTISSFILIHEQLTQKELKDLTGFSMGSISTFLSVMTGMGAIKKERIPHTHTFIYSFSGNLEDLTTKGIEIALNSFESFESYLKIKKKELNKYIEQSKKGADHLLQRIDQLLETFDLYKVLFPVIINNTTEEIELYKYQKRFSFTRSPLPEVLKIKFDVEIYLIEDDMLNQLAASPMFSSRDQMFIRILGFFMTRKYLTQKTLQRITGLSVGKISEEVNLLLENGLIEKVDVSEKGKITYGAESAGIMLLKFSRAVIYKMTKWDDEILQMKKELEDNQKDLKNLNGYSRIYRIIEFLLTAISKYQKFIKLLDKILQ
ncbi:MAG: MarR family transcriptional regulator [Candidatus Thorarchaeota archaeon]